MHRRAIPILIMLLIPIIAGFHGVQADSFNYMPWIWNSIPVICIEEKNPIKIYEEYDSTMSWAIALENYTGSKTWEYKVFIGKNPNCNVHYIFSQNLSNLYKNIDPLGFTDCDWIGMKLNCNVDFSKGLSGSYLKQVVEHETGHVLGLGHRNGTYYDIMYPSITNSDIVNYVKPKCITSNDMDALIEIYKGRDGLIGYDDQTHVAKEQFYIKNLDVCILSNLS